MNPTVLRHAPWLGHTDILDWAPRWLAATPPEFIAGGSHVGLCLKLDGCRELEVDAHLPEFLAAIQTEPAATLGELFDTFVLRYPAAAATLEQALWLDITRLVRAGVMNPLPPKV